MPSSKRLTRATTDRDLQSLRATILSDVDVMTCVMEFHASHCHGWGQGLWQAAGVCKAWLQAVKAVRSPLEEWFEYRWDVKSLSKRLASANGRIYSPRFISGGGAYAWRLLVCSQPYSDPVDEDWAVPREYLALFLCVDGVSAAPARPNHPSTHAQGRPFPARPVRCGMFAWRGTCAEWPHTLV